jgi:hypothetical protein
MGAVGVDKRLTDKRPDEPTLASTWEALAGSRLTDELLAWPADVFALTNVVLDRSEAFRFALSPVGAWPPAHFPDWAEAVEEASRQWGAWVEDRRAARIDAALIVRGRESTPSVATDGVLEDRVARRLGCAGRVRPRTSVRRGCRGA